MINKKNIMNKKAGMSYLQIIVLLVSVFAISYLFSEISVDAASSQTICCEETVDGNNCQQVPNSQCKEDVRKSPTSCDKTSYCRTGCCISPESGLCSENTPERDCNGIFEKETCGNLGECKKACCVLGDQSIWTTSANCEVEAGFLGLPMDFRNSIKSEIECILITSSDIKGACLLNEDKCKYTTLDDCNSIYKIKAEENSYFTPEVFCSEVSNCTAKDSQGCLEGEEDVYYFDSCGNPEDISNDCNFFKGSYCGKDSFGNSVCRDINCDTEDGERKHGESWCVYEGNIGSEKDEGGAGVYSRDIVGSRHFKHYCYFGQEKVEPCDDYRNEICVETKTPIESGGKISQATCRINTWRSCLDYNNLESDSKNNSKIKEECNKNPDCFIKSINMGDQFKFDTCLPKYPPGFDLIPDMSEEDAASSTAEDTKSSADAICKIASERCTEIWACGIFGCSCKVNCKCHTKEFTQEMNEFCISLGDCGAYVNYAGDISEGGYSIKASWKNPGRLSKTILNKFLGNVGVKPSSPANPGSFQFLESEQVSSDELDETGTPTSVLAKIPGALGSPLLTKIITEGLDGKDLETAVDNTAPQNVDFAKYTKSLASVKAGISSEYKLKTILGLSPGQLIGGVIAGIGLLMGSIILMVLGIVLLFLFGMSIKKNHVDFGCYAWEPPANGDCDNCNQETGCTEYRCEASGLNCQLINEGTGDSLCTEKNINTSVPIIKPWEYEDTEKEIYIPSQEYKYENIMPDGFEIRDEDNDCIEAYTTVRIGIKILNTDGELQYAQCKVDLDGDASKSYDELLDYFDENHPTSYLPYHKMDLFFPSPEAFKNQYNLTDEQVKELGQFKLYVRCKNLNGVVNPKPFEIKTCIKPGPDLTAPRIRKTIPVNGDFIEYGVEDKAVTVYVNEPATCKWSKTDKSYEDMENLMECTQDLEDYTVFGLPCETTLTGLTNSSIFYFKCKDTSENANVMKESYEYELITSSSELTIEEISPENNEVIISNVEPFAVKLKLKTSGGAEDGKSHCEWEGNGYSDIFTETDSNLHFYDLSTLTKGKYILNFKCEDAAGNIATATTTFRIRVDDDGPKITRAYYDAGLKIMTDEEAECRYDFTRNFIYENATIMAGDGYEHIGDWRISTYYIQCQDKFETKGGILKIRPYDLFF